MANQGILAQSKPTAATDTVLYSALTDESASAVLTIANDGTGSAYDVAVKDYDQKLTVNGSGAYLLHPGDIVTGYQFTVDTAFQPSTSGLSGGLQVTSTDGEKKFRFESHIKPATTTVYVKSVAIRTLALESVTGTLAVGETVSTGVSPNDTVATIYGVNGTVLYIGPSTINGGGAEFIDADAVTLSGGATGTVSVGGVGTAENKFAFSQTTAIGIYDLHLTSSGNYLNLFNERLYRFDVSDSSMTGHLFQISSGFNGEWGADGLAPSNPSDAGDANTEFTTNKTVSGTAGSASAYVEYDFSQSDATPSILYWYNGDLGTATNNTYGSGGDYIDTTASPTFTSFYAYSIEGTWANSIDAFTLNDVTYTITAQTAGPYGVVRSYSGTDLEIIKLPGSADFAGTNTFQDCPLLTTATRSTVTVSSVQVATDAVEAKHYLTEGKSNTNNNVDRITSLVIGPGQRLIVNSATANNVFTLVGFEDVSTGFPTRTMYEGTNAPV